MAANGHGWSGKAYWPQMGEVGIITGSYSCSVLMPVFLRDLQLCFYGIFLVALTSILKGKRSILWKVYSFLDCFSAQKTLVSG